MRGTSVEGAREAHSLPVASGLVAKTVSLPRLTSVAAQPGRDAAACAVLQIMLPIVLSCNCERAVLRFQQGLDAAARAVLRCVTRQLKLMMLPRHTTRQHQGQELQDGIVAADRAGLGAAV